MIEFADLASNPANVAAPGPQAAGLKKVGRRDLGLVSLGTSQASRVSNSPVTVSPDPVGVADPLE